MNLPPVRVALLVVLVAVTLGGCGSILSSSEIASAQSALTRAANYDAESLAIYEYVSAEAYLSKAREEWGRSDFQKAVEYASRAFTLGVQAYERAIRSPQRDSRVADPELEALDAPVR